MHILFQNITVVLIVAVICFFLALSSVLYFIKKYPEERTYKYIPAIVSFIIFVYAVFTLIFQTEPFASNILLLFLDVIIAAMSFFICIFSLSIAAFRDFQKFRNKAVKEEKL